MSKKLLQVEHLSIALKNPYQDLVKDISFRWRKRVQLSF